MLNDWEHKDTRSEKDKAKLWDSMAENFDNFTPQTSENNEMIRLMEELHLINENSRVLDLGCAAGKYTFYFAEHCKEVVGLDISSKMLERAEENKKRLGSNNVSFLRRDWEQLDIDEIGGNRSFDFIFANMTPAVSSKSALIKMFSACSGFCWYGGSAGRKRRINDKVYEMFDLPMHTQGNEQRIPSVFNEVWQAGMRPYLYYVKSHSEFDITLERALTYYENAANSMLRLEGKEEIGPSQREKLKKLLEENLKNGVIHEEISGNTAVLIWNIRKEEN